MQAFDLSGPPLEQDEHGVIRVTGTRVQLETVVAAFDAGATPEEIVQDYTTLTLPAVYAIIAYVLQNRAQIDVYLARRRIAVDAIRHDVEKRFPQTSIRQRLLKRKAQAESG